MNLIKKNLKNIDEKLVKKVDKKGKNVVVEKKEENKEIKNPVKTLTKKEKMKMKKTQWHESLLNILLDFL